MTSRDSVPDARENTASPSANRTVTASAVSATAGGTRSCASAVAQERYPPPYPTWFRATTWPAFAHCVSAFKLNVTL